MSKVFKIIRAGSGKIQGKSGKYPMDRGRNKKKDDTVPKLVDDSDSDSDKDVDKKEEFNDKGKKKVTDSKEGRDQNKESDSVGSKSNKKTTVKVDDKKKMDQEESEIWVCKMCNKEFKDNNCHVMECERCSEKFCRDCLSLKASEYKFLTKREDLHWFCATCDPIAKQSWIIQGPNQLELTLKKINEELENLQKKFMKKLIDIEHSSVTEKKVEEIIQKHMNESRSQNKPVECQTKPVECQSNDSLKTCLSCTVVNTEQENPNTYAQVAKKGSITNDITEMLKKALENNQMNKRKDREIETDDRQKNIIIHRVPESKEGSRDKKREEDANFFKSLCKVLEIEDLESDRVFRLVPPQAGKDRPLKVVLKSEYDKSDFMR